jgi:nucleotide-binding universal stress UspA family protein
MDGMMNETFFCAPIAIRKKGNVAMYKHVMLPYDGSELSDRALTEGIAFAKHSGAKITLMFVVTPYHLPIGGDHGSDMVKEIEHRHAVETEKHANEMLERGRQRASEAGVQCETIVRPGFHPHQEIIKTVGERKCDLILMASHGRRGLQGLLLGSETVKVLTHCSIPVLVVR